MGTGTPDQAPAPTLCRWQDALHKSIHAPAPGGSRGTSGEGGCCNRATTGRQQRPVSPNYYRLSASGRYHRFCDLWSESRVSKAQVICMLSTTFRSSLPVDAAGTPHLRRRSCCEPLFGESNFLRDWNL